MDENQLHTSLHTNIKNIVQKHVALNLESECPVGKMLPDTEQQAFWTLMKWKELS